MFCRTHNSIEISQSFITGHDRKFCAINLGLHQLKPNWMKVLKFVSPALWCDLLVRGANCLLSFPPPFEGVSFPRHISQPRETPPVSVFKYKAVSQESAATAAAPAGARGSVLTPLPWKPHAPLPLFHICSDVEKVPRGRRQHMEVPHVIITS